MEINYENLVRIVDKIPLSNDREIIYEVDGTSIFITHDLHLNINGRGYDIDPINYPDRKAFGFLSVNGKPGTICFHYDAPINEQRSWILHELTELELMAIGKSREEAHKIAKGYEESYIKDSFK